MIFFSLISLNLYTNSLRCWSSKLYANEDIVLASYRLPVADVNMKQFCLSSSQTKPGKEHVVSQIP